MDNISDILLDWYARHGRDLPWRRTRDPYRIWLSEVILQQTRVAQGMDYYLRFTERFPDVGSLARRSGGRGAQVVAGTRLLQPCAQPARRGAAGRGAVRRRVSPVLRRGPLVAGRRRLYRRGRLLGRLRRSLRRARRQCFPGAGAAFRYRPSDRLHGRKAHVRQTGADAARQALSGALQSGRHGFRGAAMHSGAARMRRLSACVALSGSGCRNGCGASRQAVENQGARPLVQLPARYMRRPDLVAAARGRRHLAGAVRVSDDRDGPCGGFFGTNRFGRVPNPVLGGVEWRLLRSVAMPKHQLSHQTLHAVFHRIEISFPVDFPSVPTATLGDYAVPRLIDRYLDRQP